MTDGVIIPDGVLPEKHEYQAAKVLARHFDAEVTFIKPTDSYKRKTADISMLGVEWEIKSPVGHSRSSTIQNQIRRAVRQSRAIVVDGRRMSLDDTEMMKRIVHEARQHRSIQRLLFIDKQGRVIEIIAKKRYPKT